MLSYERQPGAVRLLLLLGGLGMVVAPFLKWSVNIDVPNGPLILVGTSTVKGNIVLLMGAVTVMFALVPRFAPLAIATGLVGGACAGLRLFEVLPVLPYVTGPIKLPAHHGLGIGLTLAGAALAGAGGIVGLAVASAVQAREQP